MKKLALIIFPLLLIGCGGGSSSSGGGGGSLDPDRVGLSCLSLGTFVNGEIPISNTCNVNIRVSESSTPSNVVELAPGGAANYPFSGFLAAFGVCKSPFTPVYDGIAFECV